MESLEDKLAGLGDKYFSMHRYNCAEAVFLAGQEVLELDGNVPSSVATGFGGGMGMRGSVCGALTGAVIVIGLHYNRTSPGQKDLYREASQKVNTFLSAFTELHGSIHCQELTGYDLADPVQLKEFGKDRERREKCCGYVHTAIKLLVENL